MTITRELDQALHRQRQGLPPWAWFDRRVRTHHASMAALGGRPLRGEEAARRIAERLTDTSADRPRVLYLHVPFCQKICTFCAFVRQPVGPQLASYADALAGEIEAAANWPWSQARRFDAVYFGGGTPTVLPADVLASLVRRVAQRFPLAADCEFTVEARFDGIDEMYLAALREAGVNRLSFGVQTFDTVLRRRVGRLADREHVLHMLDVAGRIGFRSISVDLLYNLPGQTAETWAADLHALAGSPVSGASVYALVPFPQSGLMRAIAAGRESALGGVDAEYHLFQLADQIIRNQAGWTRMQPFHYGQCDQETCAYNASRSGRSDVLGLGCGAGGDLGGTTYMHEMQVAPFVEHPHDRGIPVMACVERDPLRTAQLEAFALLDAEGIGWRQLAEIVPAFMPAAQRLVELGLLAEDAERLRLTPDGCFWSYNLAAMLCEAIAADAACGEAPADHHGHPARVVSFS